MRIATIIMVSLVCSLMLLAADAKAEDEIYRWVDENGVVHFGDRPDGHADAQQVHVPKSVSSAYQAPTTPVPAAEGEPTEPQPSYAQQRRDERAANRQEAAEKQKVVSGNCERSREVVTQLEPSPRVNVTHEDGTVTRMDDNERLKVLNKAKTYIAENCDK